MPDLSKNIKIILILLSLAVSSLVTFRLSLVYAQDPLQKAQADYTFQFTKYRDIWQKYISNKASYESFKTATAKNDSYQTTQDYLRQIDNLYISYILLVKEYGNSVNWQGNDEKRSQIITNLETELSYIQDHQKKVSGAKTLEELPPIAKELKDHINGITLLTTNKAQTIYEMVSMGSDLNEFDLLTKEVNSKISQRYQNKNNTVITNWLSEIENIRNETTKSIDQAKAVFSRTEKTTAQNDELKQISNFTQRARSQLKLSKPLFDEILRIL